MASRLGDGQLVLAPILLLFLLPDSLAFSSLVSFPVAQNARASLPSTLRKCPMVINTRSLRHPSVCTIKAASTERVQESLAEMEMSHVLEDGSLAERLEKTLEELRTLQSSVKSDIQTAEEVLKEKRRVLEMVEDRMARLNRELLQAQVEEQIEGKKKTPGIIVGDGRVGHALKEMGVADDVTVRSTSELRYQLKEHPGGVGGSGPIYLCVPNKVLREVIEATPEDRRADLVFMGSGYLESLLEEYGLQDNTQAFLFFAIPKLGATPIDGHTPTNPEGLTCATGKWAEDLAVRLKHFDLKCTILDRQHFRNRGFRRLIWTCAVHVVGKLRGLKKVGEVAEQYPDELLAMMKELAAAVKSEVGEEVPADSLADLVKYTESVADFPVVVKDLTFRNGFFYDITKAAQKQKRADPCPTHSKGLRKIKAVK